MSRQSKRISRRTFLQGAAAAPAIFHIVPRSVLGGPGNTPPSETVGGALIGCGGRGGGTYNDLKRKHGLNVVQLAKCDVNHRRIGGPPNNKTTFTDFRRVLERKDIDVIAIATPPHWHALISIAAMEAGKDVVSEKPMTRFVGEGRAVADAAKRYGRMFQVGTYGRFGVARRASDMQRRKIMVAINEGKIKPREVRYVRRGGFKVAQWAGEVTVKPQPVPGSVEWDMYCGPSPLKPFHPPRIGGTHRWYWDYEGGGLGDMGQHHMDPITYMFAVDGTAPIEIEVSAPPAHAEVAGMWAWSKLKYANGFELVLESGEWGEPTGLRSKNISLENLTEDERKIVEAMPDPEPLVGFGEAVKTRKQPGGNAEAAHRTACIMHLTNIAIRTGRKIKFDPVKEVVIGDEEANRLAHQPMRAPWHL